MVANFDLKKLNSLLEDFYRLSRIRITVFDDSFQELAAFPEEVPLFCQLIRRDSEGKKKCECNDKEACQRTRNRHRSYTYKCHAGFTESIAPIRMGNIVIGYIFFGNVFSYRSYDEGWEKIKGLCHDYQVDLEQLRKACYQQPIITEDYISSAAQILHAVAEYLCLERIVSIKQRSLPVLIDEYIEEHYTENIGVIDICEKFGVGKTQLYELSKKNYGMGVVQHIRNLRIEKAKDLLINTELPISEISIACGFSDYNYFITVFKKAVGMSPKKYSKQLLRNDRGGEQI